MKPQLPICLFLLASTLAGCAGQTNPQGAPLEGFTATYKLDGEFEGEMEVRFEGPARVALETGQVGELYTLTFWEQGSLGTSFYLDEDLRIVTAVSSCSAADEKRGVDWCDGYASLRWSPRGLFPPGGFFLPVIANSLADATFYEQPVGSLAVLPGSRGVTVIEAAGFPEGQYIPALSDGRYEFANGRMAPTNITEVRGVTGSDFLWTLINYKGHGALRPVEHIDAPAAVKPSGPNASFLFVGDGRKGWNMPVSPADALAGGRVADAGFDAAVRAGCITSFSYDSALYQTQTTLIGEPVTTAKYAFHVRHGGETTRYVVEWESGVYVTGPHQEYEVDTYPDATSQPTCAQIKGALDGLTGPAWDALVPDWFDWNTSLPELWVGMPRDPAYQPGGKDALEYKIRWTNWDAASCLVDGCVALQQHFRFNPWDGSMWSATIESAQAREVGWLVH